MYKFVRGHFIADDHNSTVTACTAADLDDLIFSRWLQSATAGAIARHLIIAQSYCHRAAISMKHHVARAIVLTRPLYANWISYFRRENCTRSPAIITRHRSPPEFFIIIYPLYPLPPSPFSSRCHSIYNAHWPFFFFTGKNLYNNEHVAIKMVSRSRAFYVTTIREKLGELPLTGSPVSLAVAGTNEVKGTTATFRI